jgi:deoxyribonuclease V
LAHPFGFGLARVIELTLDVPCIGCAQEPLIGKYEKFEQRRENFSYLKWEEKTLGLAISTRNGSKPLIVSSAGKLPLNKIKEIILLTTQRSKLPFPLKEADRISKSLLSQKEKVS